MSSESITEIYLFESEKERAFRMERRKFYQQNKKVVEEILKIGKDLQVQAGYPRDVMLTDKMCERIWQDVGKGRELTCAIGLYALEDGPELFYNFTGEFDTPSIILMAEDEIRNLEGLVKEIKQNLQSDFFYGATCKPWFYTFNDRETFATKEEVAQAQQNFVQNLKNKPQMLDLLSHYAKNEEEKQALANALKGPEPEAHDLVTRGLTQEERKEFIRLYNTTLSN